MAHSVEGRFPFLDYRLVELCSRMPDRLKLRGLKDKYLLRQVAAKYLPPEIARRAKRPYRAPIQRSLFSKAASDYVRDLTSPPQLSAAGFFEPAAVGQLMRKAEQGVRLGESDEMALVGIISTQLLHRQFITSFTASAPVSGRDKVKVVDRRH
jgi:asparagine synthase (glutamine-hydrolysing)